MLSEPISRGDWRLTFSHRDHLKKVTPEDVLRVAKTYIKEDNRTVGMFKPVRRAGSGRDPCGHGQTGALKDFKGSAAVAQGEAFDPSHENIEKRLTRSSLPNGMKLALLSKKTRGATVHGSLTLRYADVDSASNRNRAPYFATMLLMRGTQKHTRQQIQDELDKLKTRINAVACRRERRTFRLRNDAREPARRYASVAEVCVSRRIRKTNSIRRSKPSLAAYEQALRDPQAMGSSVMRQHVTPYPKGDIRRAGFPRKNSKNQGDDAGRT